MSQAHVDLVRRIYADWAHGDFDKTDWAESNVEFRPRETSPDAEVGRGVEHMLTFSEAKTRRGRRSSALDSATVAELRAHRTRQAAERLARVAQLKLPRSYVEPEASVAIGCKSPHGSQGR